MMDISKKYILMCKKSLEMQSQWNRNKGDWYWNQIKLKICNILTDSPTRKYKAGIKRIDLKIWLPRQDQLQEMVLHITPKSLGIAKDDIKEKINTLLFRFDNFYGDDSIVYLDMFESMEQLWFAFVMKEKYGKIWNGIDWIMEPAA